MPQKQPTRHMHPWEYAFDMPHLDVQQDFRTQTAGRFSRLTGVDGRYAGRLRRFPGFKEMHSNQLDGGDEVLGSYSSDAFLLEPFAIQNGPTGSKVVRGYVFLTNNGSDQDFLKVWYSVNGGTLLEKTLYTFTASEPVNYIDVTADHQLLYFVGELGSSPTAKFEIVARYCGEDNDPSQWKTFAWDTAVPVVPSDVTAVQHSASFLKGNDRLGVAYRIVYPEQGFFLPITVPAVIDIGGEAAGAGFVEFTNALTVNGGDVFSRAVIQMFRTVPTDFDDPVDARGILHLESEWEVPRRTASLNGSGIIATTTTIDITGFISAGGLVGDTIYLTLPSTAGSVYDGIAFRRTVTAVSAGTPDTVTFTPALPIWLAGTLNWNISRTGDDADTTGSFVGSDIRPRWGWGLTVAEAFFDAPVGLDDRALVQQPEALPEEFGVFKKGNPRARLIEEYENVFVRVCPASAQEDASEQDVIRWGGVDRPRKGLIPVLNRRRMANLSNQVLDVLSVGPFLAVILNNAILRIHRSGSKLAIDTIHNRHGASGRYAAVAVGSTLYLASPIGVLVADLYSGQLDVMNATQHFFDEAGRWRDDLANVQAGYDSELGAVVFLNPTKFEMLLIWLNHGVLTHLIDCPFEHLRTGLHAVDGGLHRAILFNASAKQLYNIDAGASADSATTFSYVGESGVGPTYNGTTNTAGVASNKIEDSTATFDSPMIGHFARVRSSAGAWQRARITAHTTTTLTLDGSISGNGLRYSIGAIPFQMTAWPLSGNPDQPILDMFRVKSVYSMGAVVGSVSGDDSGNPNQKFNYQVYERDEDSAAVEAEGSLHATQTSETHANIADRHGILVPGIECWASNLQFDLLGMIVEGTIERSFKDSRPA